MLEPHVCPHISRLSDRQLLDSLAAAMRRQRTALAEIIVHLSEVEERRLHLKAAQSSMFNYCVQRLDMSEDEACRRIDLARLTKRFPALLTEVANGQISLSVALLLKPVLSVVNCTELLAAVRGLSIRQVREHLAARFPQPDVASNIRKLPERLPERAEPEHPPVRALPDSLPSSALPSLPASSSPLISTAPTASAFSPRAHAQAAPSSDAAPGASAHAPTPSDDQAKFTLQTSAARRCVARGPLASIDPLSAGRYRVQFTADAALKQQLELARDLLRHANPSGDFAAIISRALELLLDDLFRSRFGARAARKVPVPPRPANAAQQSGESRRSAAERSTTGLDPSGSTPTKAEQASRPSTAADPPSAAPGLAEPPISSPDRVEPQPTPPRRAVRRTTRRAVIERDGLGCSWVGEDGMRCGSQAWLEFDHREPAGKGGSSALDNVRLLCRAHNGLSAEKHYGRAHISRAIRRRRQRQTPRKAASPADYE